MKKYWIPVGLLYLTACLGCSTTPQIWQGEDNELAGRWKYEGFDLLFRKSTLTLTPDRRFTLKSSERIVGLSMQGKWRLKGFVVYLNPEKTIVRGRLIPDSEVAAKFLALPVIKKDGKTVIIFDGDVEFVQESKPKPPKPTKKKTRTRSR